MKSWVDEEWLFRSLAASAGLGDTAAVNGLAASTTQADVGLHGLLGSLFCEMEMFSQGQDQMIE